MKINKLAYSLLMCLGVGYSSTTLASEQIFKINNKLAQIDIEEITDKYTSILDQLTEDIKSDGLRFSYNGIKVSNEKFYIVEPKVYLKKEVFEKYEKYSEIIQNKTIWNEIINNYLSKYRKKNKSTGILGGYQSINPRLVFRMDLLDVNGKVIMTYNQFSLGADGIQTYGQFFDYINQTNKNNKAFSDLLIYSSHSTAFDLSIPEIQQIDSIKFSVDENLDR